MDSLRLINTRERNIPHLRTHDCKYKGTEEEFIKKEQTKFGPIHYIH